MSAPQKEPIEETMWRTIKILRVFDKDSLHRHVNMTHPCTTQRISRYVNRLAAQGLLHRHRNNYQLSSFAPARAPIFRKLSR